MGKIRTVRIANKLLIFDGIGPLRYLDLKTNITTVMKTAKPYKVDYSPALFYVGDTAGSPDYGAYSAASPPGKYHSIVTIPSTGPSRVARVYDGQVFYHKRYI